MNDVSFVDSQPREEWFAKRMQKTEKSLPLTKYFFIKNILNSRLSESCGLASEV